jgi:hypothetical protein
MGAKFAEHRRVDLLDGHRAFPAQVDGISSSDQLDRVGSAHLATNGRVGAPTGYRPAGGAECHGEDIRIGPAPPVVGRSDLDGRTVSRHDADDGCGVGFGRSLTVGVFGLRHDADQIRRPFDQGRRA